MLEVQVTDTVTINVDGELAQVPKGVNVIEAMRVVGKEKEILLLLPPKAFRGWKLSYVLSRGWESDERPSDWEAILDENGIQKIGWAPKTSHCLCDQCPRKECMSEPIHLV